MNESEILRDQLAIERTHAAQVANACIKVFGTAHEPMDAPPPAFRDASVSYLAWLLSRFEQRDQLLGEFIERHRSGARGPLEASMAEQLRALAARSDTSRHALSLLQDALAAEQPESAIGAWQAFGQFFNGVWCERREALERQLPRLARIDGWRHLCAIDADSILEERTRYARVAAHVPPGITLLAAQSR